MFVTYQIAGIPIRGIFALSFEKIQAISHILEIQKIESWEGKVLWRSKETPDSIKKYL